MCLLIPSTAGLGSHYLGVSLRQVTTVTIILKQSEALINYIHYSKLLSIKGFLGTKLRTRIRTVALRLRQL